jgi:hypothetical protein
LIIKKDFTSAKGKTKTLYRLITTKQRNRCDMASPEEIEAAAELEDPRLRQASLSSALAGVIRSRTKRVNVTAGYRGSELRLESKSKQPKHVFRQAQHLRKKTSDIGPRAAVCRPIGPERTPAQRCGINAMVCGVEEEQGMHGLYRFSRMGWKRNPKR